MWKRTKYFTFIFLQKKKLCITRPNGLKNIYNLRITDIKRFTDNQLVIFQEKVYLPTY